MSAQLTVAPRRWRATPLAGLDAVEATSHQTGSARKRVVAHDPYLSGHYPDFPIFPGLFVVEAAVQTAELILCPPPEPQWVTLFAVDSIRFLAPAFPGDLLCVGVTIAEIDPGLFRVDARIENAAQKTIAVAKFQVGLGDHSDD